MYNGKPSVSTIQAIENKPFLNDWRERIGKAEADRIGGEARELGSEVDAMAMQYMKDKKIPFSMNPIAIKLFYQFKAWHDSKVQTVIYTQHEMVGERYGGTCDLICELKTGEIAMVDIKTNKQCNVEMGDQLSAYTALYEESGNAIDKLLIVRLKKKPAELANPRTKCQVKSYEYNMNVFNALLTIWENRNGR